MLYNLVVNHVKKAFTQAPFPALSPKTRLLGSLCNVQAAAVKLDLRSSAHFDYFQSHKTICRLFYSDLFGFNPSLLQSIDSPAAGDPS